jgi:hypothetical protein
MAFIVDSERVTSGFDFLLTHHGSLCLLEPLTPEGEEWAGEHLISPEVQLWGRAIVIEPRYAGDILNGIAGDGLEVTSHNRTIH